MRNTFVNTVFDLAKSNHDIFLITGDLGFNVLTEFWEEYPDRFINAGICEQNMTSVAAGMALEGKTVFTYSIANFPTARCLEQIRNDVAYHRANVKIVAVGAGFSYGALGMSHHATEDIAIIRAIPEMTVFTPCDPQETAAVTRLATELDGPCYIRLGRGGEANLHHADVRVEVGKANILRSGKDVAILVAGAIANEALAASDILSGQGIDCAVYSFPTVKPIDKNTILELANRFDFLFTLEEHTIIGGFGSAVAEIVAESRARAAVVRMGLQDVFSSAVGSQDYLRAYYKIDATGIADMMEKRVKKEARI